MSDPHAPNPQGPDPEQQSPYGDAPRAPQYAPPQHTPPQYAPPQYVPPNYAPQQYYALSVNVKARTNGAGVAAMICGIVAAVVGVWTLVPFLGMSAARRYEIGRGMSVSGLVLGYGTLALMVGVLLFWIWAIASGASWYDPYYW